MNIAIPILTFSKAGGHRVLAKLASIWCENGHKVEIILCYESESYFPLDKRIKITHLKGKNVFNNIKNIVNYIRKNYYKYDVIIANQNRTAFYLFWGCVIHRDFSKCYYYIQAYESDFYKFGLSYGLDNFFKIYAALSYYLPLKKIVNSNLYLEYKNIRADGVVYPGIDLELYYHKDVSFFNKRIKIGTIGRKEAWKGTADVCKAMEILRSEGIDFDFYIAFNDYDTIPHYFVRPDGDENLSAFYRDMDIIVATCKGQHGAIHYPIIEAMAVGSTVVCTDYYPANENNAYKVDELAPKQIASNIKCIIADKEEAVIKRKRALIDIQQFDWSIVAQKFLNYLQEGCEEK